MNISSINKRRNTGDAKYQKKMRHNQFLRKMKGKSGGGEIIIPSLIQFLNALVNRYGQKFAL